MATSSFNCMSARGLSSYVLYLQDKHQETVTVLCMVNKIVVFDILYHYLPLAISDGILHNDALKHNQGESLNDAWTKTLKSLKFYEDCDDHINFLRRRWVLGAADMMAGNNGSLQNDKELFGYTDDEWAFIWSTMIENGA